MIFENIVNSFDTLYNNAETILNFMHKQLTFTIPQNVADFIGLDSTSVTLSVLGILTGTAMLVVLAWIIVKWFIP